MRNRNLANVFYRLGFVEIFGTGIARIKQLYKESLRKPDFEVTENTIKIMLPVYEENMNLTEDEKKVYNILSKTMLKSMSEIAPYVSFGKSKTAQLLKDMQKMGVVEVDGRGRAWNERLVSMLFLTTFHYLRTSACTSFGMTNSTQPMYIGATSPESVKRSAKSRRSPVERSIV